MAKLRVPADLKRDVWRLADGRCEYCRNQARFAMQPFFVEHISPHSRGGDSRGPTGATLITVARE
jgi:hypothetical protein